MLASFLEKPSYIQPDFVLSSHFEFGVWVGDAYTQWNDSDFALDSTALGKSLIPQSFCLGMIPLQAHIRALWDIANEHF